MPRPLAPSEDSAWLPEFLWRGEAPDLALFALAGGARVLARTQLAGERRQVDQWTLGPPIRALDRTIFRVTDAVCAETERYTSRGGPNLHPQPIALPARLRLGERVELLPGASVTLVFCGLAEHRAEPLRALALLATQGDEARLLWSGQGLGELAIVAGTPEQPGQTLREMIAWRAGDTARFGELLPPESLPELPEQARDGGRPRGVF